MYQSKLVFPLIVLAAISVGCTSEVTTTSKPSSVSREFEAREVVNSILFDQRTHYIGKQTFTTSNKDLLAKNPSMKSPIYNYKILPKPISQKGFAVMATPKQPGLRSFTGVVYAVQTGTEKLTVSEICETTEPSQKAPKVPAAPAQANKQIQCPAGSRSSLSLLARQ